MNRVMCAMPAHHPPGPVTAANAVHMTPEWFTDAAVTQWPAMSHAIGIGSQIGAARMHTAEIRSAVGTTMTTAPEDVTILTPGYQAITGTISTLAPPTTTPATTARRPTRS